MILESYADISMGLPGFRVRIEVPRGAISVRAFGQLSGTVFSPISESATQLPQGLKSSSSRIMRINRWPSQSISAA